MGAVTFSAMGGVEVHPHGADRFGTRIFGILEAISTFENSRAESAKPNPGHHQPLL
jgi:hypothetical protein